MYVNFFVQKDLLMKRVWDLDVQLGSSMMLLLAGLAWTARKSMRVTARMTFLRVHLGVAGIVLILLYYHQVYSQVYVWEAGAIYLVGLLHRWTASVKAK